MGDTYTLVNHTKRVFVGTHMPFGKASEWVGNPAGAAIVAWYLLRHQGDQIQFVSDGIGDDLEGYSDNTSSIVEMMVQEGILSDYGKSYEDQDKPHVVFTRDIRFRMSYLYPHDDPNGVIDLPSH